MLHAIVGIKGHFATSSPCLCFSRACLSVSDPAKYRSGYPSYQTRGRKG